MSVKNIYLNKCYMKKKINYYKILKSKVFIYEELLKKNGINYTTNYDLIRLNQTPPIYYNPKEPKIKDKLEITHFNDENHLIIHFQ